MQKSLVCVAVLLTAACSGESEPPPTVNVTVGATGGDVTSDDGQVELSIPEGALAAETQITVQKLGDETAAAAAGFAPGTVYVFGPEGTEFAQPLVIEFAPAAGDLRVARLVDGAVGKFADATQIDPETGRISATVHVLGTWGLTECDTLYCLSAEAQTNPDLVSVKFHAPSGFSLSRAVKACPGATNAADCEAYPGTKTFTAWQVTSGDETELHDTDIVDGPNLYFYLGPDGLTEVSAFLDHTPPPPGMCGIDVTISPNPTTFNSATVATVIVDRKGVSGPIVISLLQAPVEHAGIPPIPDGQNATSFTMFPFQKGMFVIMFKAMLEDGSSCQKPVVLTVN